jgi:hypothetical protein
MDAGDIGIQPQTPIPPWRSIRTTGRLREARFRVTQDALVAAILARVFEKVRRTSPTPPKRHASRRIRLPQFLNRFFEARQAARSLKYDAVA